MNSFDAIVLAWFNQFARRSYVVDAIVYDLAYFNLVKGTPFVLALLWLWLTPGDGRRRNREIVIATVAGAFLAVTLGRFLASELPLRLRPMSSPEIAFVLPYTVRGNALRAWSAFPSDTAMFFSAMATGLWFASRRLGIAAHVFAAIFIGLPRLYVGLHHPTDLLAGAAIGILVGAAVVNARTRAWIAALPLRFADAYPSVAALAGMVVALQMATMFDDVRALLRDSNMVAQVAWCGLSGRTGCDDAIGVRTGAVDARAGAVPDPPVTTHVERQPQPQAVETRVSERP